MANGKEFDSIEEILKKLPQDDYEKVRNVLYGQATYNLNLSEEPAQLAKKYDFELQAYGFLCDLEQVRAARKIRVGIFQHKIPGPTNTPIREMREANHELAKQAIEVAFKGGVNVFCFQEAWNMPFGFCTREKQPWCQYAENAENGPTITYLQELAKLYNMVIISPILEREDVQDKIWNTAVVIDNHGIVMGKHRKNHIPRIFDFNESTYYFEGNTGHPVFETEFGKIGINICYGRHHPMNWQMFGINGADLVFNPSATIGAMSEPLWGIEARNAAIANNYYTFAINRVGTEVYDNEFTSGNGKPAHKDFGHFYGSSYATAPNGSRTPGLSRTRSGLLITELDLNLCRQVKDQWCFQMTQRLDMYAESFTKALSLDYKPQVIKN